MRLVLLEFVEFGELIKCENVGWWCFQWYGYCATYNVYLRISYQDLWNFGVNLTKRVKVAGVIFGLVYYSTQDNYLYKGHYQQKI